MHKQLKFERNTLLIWAIAVLLPLSSIGQTSTWSVKKNPIQTIWAFNSPENVLPEYPRPQQIRSNWTNLNGLWDYAISTDNNKLPSRWAGKILVPFPIESALSGVKKKIDPTEFLWYRKLFSKPGIMKDERVILHFGAVDYLAVIFVNGQEVFQHEGGYSAFSVDITKFLKSGTYELKVKVKDPTDEGIGPHGKQVLQPGGMYYTSCSGIWQTVWYEIVPADYIKSMELIPNVDKSILNVIVKVSSDKAVRSKLQVRVRDCEGCDITSKYIKNKNISFQIKIPNAKLWSPYDPFLYNFDITLGKDKVQSYFGMRKIELKKDSNGYERIHLNNKYIYNLGTLDQGYWPDGIYTAPTDEALAFDIKAIKSMGFNTIRKHIKVESARWYYHADKLGILVWQDLVNPNQKLPAGSKKVFEKQSAELLNQLKSYPCITTWVVFNEGWGAYDKGRITKWVKSIDKSRLVNGHSGALIINYASPQNTPENLSQESQNSDMTDVHSYPPPGMPAQVTGKGMVLGEFGGIGVLADGHLWDDLSSGWGYGESVSSDTLLSRYESMIDSLVVFEKRGLTASIYTQPFDVESERNGFITYDRKLIKAPIDQFRRLHRKIIQLPKNFENINIRAKNFNLTSYQQQTKEYIAGNRDSAFLRALAIKAFAEKDTFIFKKAAHEYIVSLKDPFQEVNLRFIRKFMFKPTDDGFNLLFENRKRVNEILGYYEAEGFLLRAISKGHIEPYLNGEKSPNWFEIKNNVFPKYGDLGEQAFLQAQTFYALNHNNWELLSDVIKPWFNKYGRYNKFIGKGLLNDMAWKIFENVSDKSILEIALVMSKKSLGDIPSANILDTYANVLYKLGHTDEALKIEKKVILDDPYNADYKKHYERMLRSEPTWLTIPVVKFTNSTSLEQVFIEAKKNSKLILLDFMATWCGPCHDMERDVYSDRNIGNFLNKNFISVKLQIDKTKNDSDLIKSWHEKLPEMIKKHQITTLPTIVILSSNGEFVKSIIGAMDKIAFMKALSAIVKAN